MGALNSWCLLVRCVFAKFAFELFVIGEKDMQYEGKDKFEYDCPIQAFLRVFNESLSDTHLILYEAQRTVSLLDKRNSRLIAQQRLTPNEWGILLALMSVYPHYTPYETLLAVTTSLSVAQCRRELQAAQRKGTKYFKCTFRPAARVIAGVRTKLECVVPSLHIVPLHQCGSERLR